MGIRVCANAKIGNTHDVLSAAHTHTHTLNSSASTTSSIQLIAIKLFFKIGKSYRVVLSHTLAYTQWYTECRIYRGAPTPRGDDDKIYIDGRLEQIRGFSWSCFLFAHTHTRTLLNYTILLRFPSFTWTETIAIFGYFNNKHIFTVFARI